MDRFKGLIKLADNPVEPEYFGEEDTVNNGTAVAKGRKVGPARTKLSNSEERLFRIENAVGSLANSVATLAKHMAKDGDMGGEGFMDDYDSEEDPMDIEMPDMEDEDELALSEDGYFGSDFDPYGGEDTVEEDSDEELAQWEPEDVEGVSHEGDVTKARVNRARTNKGRINRARISKDNEASSFGEKDEDIPGNRPLDPDNKKRPATDWLIQGASDDGPGPVSKAVLQKAVRAELVRAGVIRKSTGPAPSGSSKISKASADPTMYDLVMAGKERSFQELNRARIAFGQMSSGVL